MFSRGAFWLSKKFFQHAVRLLRKVLNFVFLRTMLYAGTACEQKTENAKIAANSMFAAIFLNYVVIKFCFGIGYPVPVLNALQNNFGVFQDLYRLPHCFLLFYAQNIVRTHIVIFAKGNNVPYGYFVFALFIP